MDLIKAEFYLVESILLVATVWVSLKARDKVIPSAAFCVFNAISFFNGYILILIKYPVIDSRIVGKLLACFLAGSAFLYLAYYCLKNRKGW